MDKYEEATFEGTKTETVKRTPLELLQAVMYATEKDKLIGEKDQAYEELKCELKTLEKELELYKQLHQKYQYLSENTNDYDLNIDAVDIIHNEIYELEQALEGKQE